MAIESCFRSMLSSPEFIPQNISAISSCTYSVTLLFSFCLCPLWLVMFSEQWRKNMWLHRRGIDWAIHLSVLGTALFLSNSPNLYNYPASAVQGFFLIEHRWTVWAWILAQAQHPSSTLWCPWMRANMTISKQREAETRFRYYSKMRKFIQRRSPFWS